MSKRDPWYEDDNPDRVSRAIGGRLILWIAVFAAAFGLIGAAAWGIKVVTAPAKGQGDAFRTQQSGTNRIAAQERFEDLYQDVLAADRKLDPASAAMKADPKSQVARTNYTGLVNYCLDVVADYNAEARKYTSADFRAIDLPAQIDSLSPDTDCQETSR